MSLSLQVLSFARGKMGKKVGSGECWDLADQALEAAGAKCSHDYGAVGADTDYKWGTSVQLAGAQAGDVIQYRDFKWVRRVTHANGAWEENEFTYPHHTAILGNKKQGSSDIWDVYEQNIKQKRTVQKNEVYLANTEYTDSDGATVTIKVSGTFWIYRAQKKD